jgi:hypothetical protein
VTSRSIHCLAAGVLGVLLVGCAGETPDAETQARRDHGKQEAIYRDFKNATDCGALTDKEEIRGCAEYVNSLDD